QDRVMTGNGPAIYTTQTWGWGYQILPFIEQQALWAIPQGPTAPGGDVTVASTPLKIYNCPSLRGATIFPYSQATWGAVAGGKRAQMDYVGNGGTYGSWGGFGAGTNSLDGPIVPSVSGSSKTTKLVTITKGTS